MWDFDLINKLKEWNYSGKEIFTKDEKLFNYLYSNFTNVDIITDNIILVLKKKIIDYANSYDIELKKDFEITTDIDEDWSRCFTIDQKDVVTDLWDENYIELVFWD